MPTNDFRLDRGRAGCDKKAPAVVRTVGDDPPKERGTIPSIPDAIINVTSTNFVSAQRKKAPAGEGRGSGSSFLPGSIDDGHDFPGLRVDNVDTVTNHEKLMAFKLGGRTDDLLRHRGE
jgi:hypothetical protein